MPLKTQFHITNFLQPPTTELSHFLTGDNQLVICNGVNPSYKRGTLIKDLGYQKVGSTIQSNKAITGLFNFRQSSSVQKMLATVNDSTGADLELYYSTGGSWTEIPAAQVAWAGYEDSLVEMEGFIGYCFFVGYDSTDNVFLPVGSLTGTTFSTSTNVTSMPTAKYIKRYRDRLYIANCFSGSAQPFRVYYSSVPSAGAITWTTATDFFDVDYSEQITGLGSNWDRLMIFTEFSGYMYNQDQLMQSWDIGCGNHRTIQNLGRYMIWANKDNVYASTGGDPVPVANDVLELIRRATVSNFRSAVVDGEYVLYIGSTQANGLSYSNCVLTYNVDSGMWRWREMYDSISALARYTTGGDDFLYIGASDGDVHVKSKYTDTTLIYADDGNAISSHWRTRAYDFGDPSIKKEVSKLVAYSEYAQGLHLAFRLFDKNQEAIQEFKPLGDLKKAIQEINGSLSGYFIQFEGRELSKNQAWRFYGFTALVAPDNKL